MIVVYRAIIFLRSNNMCCATAYHQQNENGENHDKHKNVDGHKHVDVRIRHTEQHGHSGLQKPLELILEIFLTQQVNALLDNQMIARVHLLHLFHVGFGVGRTDNVVQWYIIKIQCVHRG